MKEQHKGRVERRRCHRALLARLAVVMTIAMMAPPASARITFTFNYTDPAGVGFNAAGSQGAARKTALVQTADLLADFFPTYTATITMDVNGSETDDATLAAAGSNFNAPAAASCAAGYNRGDVGIKILGGADPAPAAADGSVTVNFEDHGWDFDDNVAPGQFDFKSTMLHELLHAVGFSHSVTQDGKDGCGTQAPAAGGWNPYDQHLGNTTAKFINSSFVIATASWAAAVIGGTGNAGVLWRGANALAANGGNPIPLFSPTAYSAGSSISHLDDDFFTTSALLMESATFAGPGTRTLSGIEVGMMKDIGFTNTRGTSIGSLISAIYLLLF